MKVLLVIKSLMLLPLIVGLLVPTLRNGYKHVNGTVALWQQSKSGRNFPRGAKYGGRMMAIGAAD